MYEISVQKHFDAAHFLRGYRGKCEAMHGHRFEVVARVRASKLNERSPATLAGRQVAVVYALGASKETIVTNVLHAPRISPWPASGVGMTTLR